MSSYWDIFVIICNYKWKNKKFTNLRSNKKTSYPYKLQLIFRYIVMNRQISVYIVHSKIISFSM